MAHSLIKGPEDYKLFYHTDGEGNIWFDGKEIQFLGTTH